MQEELFDHQAVAERVAAETLIVDVDGFEGPLDLLLSLSRAQKVDLRKISVLDLAVQYLGFIEKARELRIELAADYLVMAAWLAFLKSRLARDRLGRDRFVRGVTEDVTRRKTVNYSANLLDLMQGYARIRTRDDFRPFVMDRDSVFTMEQALQRMRGLIGFTGHWTDILSYLPDGWTDDPKKRRSATASTFAASLELAKEGKIVIRQDEIFSPIQIKRADRDG